MVDGVKLFADAFKTLLDAVSHKRQVYARELEPPDLQVGSAACRCGCGGPLEDWKRNNKRGALWQKDASLWSRHG